MPQKQSTKSHREELIPVDVPALLDRLDEVLGLPEAFRQRRGALSNDPRSQRQPYVTYA